jgi:hypothetical protein
MDNLPPESGCCVLRGSSNATAQQPPLNGATPSATSTQQPPEKSLSLRELARNKLRNKHATSSVETVQQAPRNKGCFSPPAQQALSDDPDPFWDGVKMLEKAGIVYNADCQKIAVWEKEANPPQQPINIQEAELTRLVNLVADYHEFSTEDRSEALHYALLDQQQALTCFTSLARQVGLT